MGSIGLIHCSIMGITRRFLGVMMLSTMLEATIILTTIITKMLEIKKDQSRRYFRVIIKTTGTRTIMWTIMWTIIITITMDGESGRSLRRKNLWTFLVFSNKSKRNLLICGVVNSPLSWREIFNCQCFRLKRRWTLTLIKTITIGLRIRRKDISLNSSMQEWVS